MNLNMSPMSRIKECIREMASDLKTFVVTNRIVLGCIAVAVVSCAIVF